MFSIVFKLHVHISKNNNYCRFCIRHEIPKLIKDNYLPGKVLEKINTHSYSGFVHYAQKLYN